ncbi:MAG: hypothetical protein ABI193_01005, partial [Minicystis sp.]
TGNLRVQLTSGAGLHQFFRFYEATNGRWEVGNSSAAGNKFYFNPAVGGGINGSALTIQPNGNVGIGTTTPGTKLDVTGDIRTSGTFSAAGAPYLKVTFNVYPTGNSNYLTFLSGFVAVEQKGNITFDDTGITINEAGTYLLGYDLGVNANAGCNHGWIDIGGGRYATWSWAGQSPFFAGSVPVTLAAGARVKIQLFCGTLVNDGNPKNLWALKVN